MGVRRKGERRSAVIVDVGWPVHWLLCRGTLSITFEQPREHSVFATACCLRGTPLSSQTITERTTYGVESDADGQAEDGEAREDKSYTALYLILGEIGLAFEAPSGLINLRSIVQGTTRQRFQD